jgi:hypothetical protein
MNIEQKCERIAALTKQRNEIELEIRRLSDEVAQASAPLKVGDVVECRGRLGRIVSIGARFGSSRHWGAVAVRIRKDGSDGATFRVSSYDTMTKIDQ